ncbi:DNA cytosine methyltransferase [Betaproteobacteria bacterium SCN2]|jgi:DNA (cytosine-5)-methyltransferase 1|nr:DNA cytosine methyltransferase [Betaproteobacteria bacterium SCN2]
MQNKTIPVIDLFAGPGGLGEGFSSLLNGSKDPTFKVCLSIEKDPVAHSTLSLRSIFRSFPKGKAPDAYYEYVRGKTTRDEFLKNPAIRKHVELAEHEVKNATLGETPPKKIDAWIHEAIGGQDPWVLIGGPPCQAYSIAGRSRMRGVDPKAFEEDKRHLLYREYLRIIKKFGPSVFVMENVKGILTSEHKGSLIFERILEDLSIPGNGLEYDIRSFVVPMSEAPIRPEDFVIRAEDFGIPQKRHRVILFGIRKDLAHLKHDVLKPSSTTRRISVHQALSGLPPIRSRLSKEPDSFEAWISALRRFPSLAGWKSEYRKEIESRARDAVKHAERYHSPGGRFVELIPKFSSRLADELRAWYEDPRLGGVTLHESRLHMREDLHRYLFASCFGEEAKRSPKLMDFPPQLLPNHENAGDEDAPFKDRFRVQIGNRPSTTVVSHISKDGHYYIHPDPAQCRSLTVREAARLQTFPDNYFFEGGGRTDRYAQIGNAVPPFLAKQIASIVSDFLVKAASKSR